MTERAVLKRCLYKDTPSDTHPDTASVTNKVRDSGLCPDQGKTFAAKVPKMVLNRSGIGYSGPDFFVMPLLRLISPM